MNDWNDTPQNDPWASPQAPSDPHAGHGEYYNKPTSTNGVLVLVLGVISWFACGIFTAVPGFLIARTDREMIKSGMMAPDTALEVGYWLNVAILAFTVLGLGLFFVFFAIGAAGSAL